LSLRPETTTGKRDPITFECNSKNQSRMSVPAA
jgi:hypothetical protein